MAQPTITRKTVRKIDLNAMAAARSDDPLVVAILDRAKLEGAGATPEAAEAVLLAAAQAAATVEQEQTPITQPEAWRFPKAADFGPVQETKPRTSNSAGVALSWVNPEVKAARLVRHSVKVRADGTTTEHKSVAAAFRALRLPMNVHIRFRLALKSAADGKAVFENGGKMYAFELVAAE